MPVVYQNSVRGVILDVLVSARHRPPATLRMLWIVLRTIASAIRACRDLVLGNLALRQQRTAFKARGRPPRIRPADRAFWLVLRRLWPKWSEALVIVKPDTVVR